MSAIAANGTGFDPCTQYQMVRVETLNSRANWGGFMFRSIRNCFASGVMFFAPKQKASANMAKALRDVKGALNPIWDGLHFKVAS
jgi:hypothetical protein